jgi:hypothetical protein
MCRFGDLEIWKSANELIMQAFGVIEQFEGLAFSTSGL